MNKAEMVYELMNVKAAIRILATEPSPYYRGIKRSAENRLERLMDELKVKGEKSQFCPIAEKVNRLADAIEQAVFISKEIKEPFKVEYKVPEINLHSHNAAKAAAKFADKISKRYGLTASNISTEDAEKMARGGTD